MKNLLLAIVDDYREYSITLANLLKNEKGIGVSFIACDGADFFMQLGQTRNHPDIVLMDLSMPHMNGIDATKKLKELYPSIKVIIMTNYDDEAFILEMIQHGVEGYLLKSANIKEICNAIETVMNGERYFDVNSLAKVSNQLTRMSSTSNVSNLKPNLFNLSERELEILEHLCRAKTATEIGEILNISARTVEKHRNNMLQKTNSKNTLDLVLRALYHRIVKVGKDPYMDKPFSFL